ncbi:oligosaccharide flippase family protein [Sphingomonas yantingensis]|uniref:O-antigen/teichoic acid export membrane protein n=1 Tax=Sphingomonas yantingensis TaxID=1241761 RepID=A0A7W9ATQ0_9SPHN|nr:O-antigen/teichoic acid export membrane protein [Sphingomonas yantingensis]
MRAITTFKRLFGAATGLRVNLIANYLGQGWTAAANVIFIPAYIHYLGIESFGLIGVFAIILSASSLLDAGLTPTLNRELAIFQAGGHSVRHARDLVRTANTLCVIVLVAISLAGLLLAPLLARYWIGARALSNATIVQSLFLMILVAALRIVEGVQRGALLGLQRHVLLNMLSIFTVSLRAGGVIVPLAFVSATPQMFFAWQAGVSAFSVLAFAFCVHASLPRQSGKARFDPAIVRSLRGFAGGVLGATALAVFLTQADKILLVKLIPLDQFSAYALATAIAAGLYQLVAPVAQSYYPMLTSRIAGDQKQLAATYHQGSQIVAATIAPPAAILILFAQPVLDMWTGNPALATTAAPILSLLAFGTLLHCFMYLPYMLQLAAGWSGLAMRMNALSVLIVFPTLLLVVPRSGMIGAAFTWVGLNLLALMITIQIMHRRLLRTEMRSWYLHDVLVPVSASFLIAGLCRLAFPAAMPLSIRVIALALACVITLAAGVLASSLARGRIAELIARKRAA